MNADKITIQLTKNEAIVLFNFLSNFSNSEKLEIEHQSEERVLWNLCCDLEKILVEPFQENYKEILEVARESVKDK